MNTYTANFSTGTVTKNFKRSDYTHAWKVTGTMNGDFFHLGCGFATNKKDAEKRAQAQINFCGYGEPEIVEAEAA